MDTDKIKQFFILHFEKLILGLVVLVSMFLVYSGLQLPDFLQSQQPDKLTSKASQVKLAIDDDHSEAFIEERIPTYDIIAATERLYTPVDDSPYKLRHPWEAQNEQSVVRRQDPALPAPLDLRTHGVATSIAIKGSKIDPLDYPLASLEPADAVEKVEAPAPRRPRRSRRGMGMDEMGMGMDGMDMGMDMMGMDMMGMDMGMMGMDMDMGMEGATGPIRKLKPEFDFGLRPIAGEDKRNPKPSVGWFIAGTALLPHREIYEAYEMALKDADAYDPRRDTPLYFNFEVERADVTDKPIEQLVDADWTRVWHLKRYAELADGFWAGYSPEIVNQDYREDQLTVWIPPVLLDDYRPWSIHPRIPMLSQAEITKQELIEQEAIEDAKNPDFEFDKDDNIELSLPGTTGGGGMDYGGMDMGYGMDGMDMMAGGGMMMMGRGKVEIDPVEHKLMRFYDFAGNSIFKNAPVYGRTYVYRMRYAVIDPNFPASQLMQPKTSSLAPEVARRVMDKMNDAVKQKKRDFQRWSEWSAPSEPASLPTLESYVAGAVEPGAASTWAVAGRPVQYQRDESKAKVVATQLIPKYGVKVPMEIEVFKGGVLSQKAEFADVVDPITLEIKKLPDPEFVSSSTVVDLDGGRPLKIASDLTEPGMILMFDQSGQLQLRNEIDDQELFRIETFADEKGL
ncbi:hypothetical protein [Rubripirellula reticaptiva]|uniref:Uncharacterized protein n=1 Tax=Rubripirellula reticaptiva TaxID=2528013 RepID=A0A5C6EI21_9BACT|nr:hypothetical protein [Rubripirellula reticaptiva]TWU49393.1 hypothetical protein Poly59_40080 [Rubripirellula reticaptiva]